MTPAEAKASIDRYAQEVIALTECAEGEPDRMREVVEAERERCAQFAYSWYDGEPEVAEDLRAAIRAIAAQGD